MPSAVARRAAYSSSIFSKAMPDGPLWLWPHSAAKPRTDTRSHADNRGFQESAQIRPRFARVDQILDAECLGGQERRSAAPDLGLDLDFFLRRIRGGFDLA